MCAWREPRWACFLGPEQAKEEDSVGEQVFSPALHKCTWNSSDSFHKITHKDRSCEKKGLGADHS